MAKKSELVEHHPEVLRRFHMAHLYYIMMVISAVLCMLTFVQAVVYQVNDEVNFALGFYTMAVMLAIVAKSSYTRGKGHYHYHGHLQ